MESIVMIPIYRIKEGQRYFPPLTEDEMIELMTSINQNGILTPLLVGREPEGGYELRSGWNRIEAARRLGMGEVPCSIIPNEIKGAAIFDTDIIRRHLTIQERQEMSGIKLQYNKEILNTLDLINDLKSIAHYLPLSTLEHLAKIPRDEQQRIYNAIPEKIIENSARVHNLEKTILLYESQLDTLREKESKTKIELEKLTKYKESYDTLQKTKQEELESLAAKKVEELEKEYQDADSAIKTAVEKERVKIEEALKGEIEDAKQLASEMSQEVDKKKSELDVYIDKVVEIEQDKKSLTGERNKLSNQVDYLKKIVAAVASPGTIAERCKIVLNELDQIRNSLIQLTQEALQKEHGTKATIKKTINEILVIGEELKTYIEIMPDTDKI